jgi:hypothetical protein
VKNHRYAIPTELHVQLDPIPGVNGAPRRAQTILDEAGGTVVQAPVRKRDIQKS